MSGIDEAQVKEQLEAWRQKLDTLRLKAHLFKMEYRDKPLEAQEQLEQAYGRAKAKFHELKEAGSDEASRVGESFRAAWDAFRKRYDDMTDGE